ncbi:outer membrane beta-barrel family protein [Sediminicola sp. YIK13]|uniref:outer membrane beta-barrel family protein n=1 Tax=Sediminicola sp. YIK13 TaxID=1453352 RepID=UPI001F416728|nr:outer membrane beta-barrel family protein [Sediminicola sp. YIK13]
MKLSFLVLIMPLIMPLCLSAQTYEVTGAVKDRNNEAVGYANVLLLQVSDSTVVQGASTDDSGRFVITNVQPKTYFIRASYIGSTSNLIAVDVRKNTSIGSIIIEDSSIDLEGVEIVVRKPTVVRKSDRLVFNVENTIASLGNSWDVLRKTPGVIMVNEQLKIKNQTPIVYLNNRKVQLTNAEIKNLLEGVSGANIKSVEVIMNPPASYDAEGGPILNIITSKNITPGYKGSVNGDFIQAIFPKYNFGTSHYFKTEKLSVFANYSISPRKEYKDNNGYINFIDDNGVFARWQSTFNRTTRSAAQNANLILDYAIDDRNTFNITSNLAVSPNKTFDNISENLMRNAQNMLDSTFISASKLNIDQANLGIDLNYVHTFKKEGASLALNAHYTDYYLEQDQFVSSDYFDSTNNFTRNFSFLTQSNQNIEIYTGQADYLDTFGKLSLESGAKFSNINSRSGLDYFNVTGNTQTMNVSLSDIYDYDETVFAGYITMVQNWDKFSIKAGLRGEQTNVEGKSMSVVETNVQDYFELFPSLYLLYNQSDNHSFSFNYGRKLSRPKYQDLNPFLYFLNENVFNQGNPNLRPNFSHNFNFNYTYKGEYFLDVYYRDNGNFISTLSFQDNQNQTVREVRQNVLESTSYGFDFTYIKSITNNWFLIGITSLFHEDETFLAIESGNIPVTNEVEGVFLYLGNNLTLSKDGTFTGELGLNYISKFLLGSYVISETTNLTFGLRKTLWNNRATISLSSEDILGKANGTLTSTYLNQDNSYSPRPETQFIRFGFAYNFGNFRLKDSKRTIDKIERDRLESN